MINIIIILPFNVKHFWYISTFDDTRLLFTNKITFHIFNSILIGYIIGCSSSNNTTRDFQLTYFVKFFTKPIPLIKNFTAEMKRFAKSYTIYILFHNGIFSSYNPEIVNMYRSMISCIYYDDRLIHRVHIYVLDFKPHHLYEHLQHYPTALIKEGELRHESGTYWLRFKSFSHLTTASW